MVPIGRIARDWRLYVAAGIAAAVLGASPAGGQPADNAHGVPAEQNAHGTGTRKSEPQTDAQHPNGIAAAVKHIEAAKQQADSGDQGAAPNGEASEYWTVAGRRLKVTDTVLAFFTLGLVVIGTWQGHQLRRTVNAMKTTEERQLRAYVSVTPRGVRNFKVGINPQIQCETRNHGQTPAISINYRFNIDIIPAAAWDDFEFPPPTRVVNRDTSLFPTDMISWFNHDEALTAEQIRAIDAGESVICIWGVTTYRDIFKRQRQTEFSGAIGGPGFANERKASALGKTAPIAVWTYGKNHSRST